jgi:phage shock protein PspC (stress-responsive transcriptional regulator)
MNRITVAKTAAYVIAAIAVVSSYGHQVHLLSLADLDPLFGFVPSEWVTPVTVDSLAIVALMVRMSYTVTESTKRWATLPLVLAGGLSVAANEALARNVVQVVVGAWTVAAYILAELFVSKMERKVSAPAEEPKVAVKVTDAEKAARKRAKYGDMDRAAKAEWTKRYRARTGATAPTSPGYGPVSAPPAAQLEDAVR